MAAGTTSIISFSPTVERTLFVQAAIQSGLSISDVRIRFMEKFGLGINAFGQYLLAAQHASERKEMFNARHLKDADGDPDGGVSWGTGFNIAWHSGCPLERANGALPENVIGAALDRLEHLQNSRYSSPYYGQAIGFLKDALAALEERVIEVK